MEELAEHGRSADEAARPILDEMHVKGTFVLHASGWMHFAGTRINGQVGRTSSSVGGGGGSGNSVRMAFHRSSRMC